MRIEWKFIKCLLFITAVSGCLWGQRQVAITIDDLPRGGDARGSLSLDRAMTIKLLTPFQKEQIPLTGFVNECHHADEAGDLLLLWAAAGADLGNHTCSHLDLNSVSIAAFEADVLKGETVTTTALLPLSISALRKDSRCEV
jgi:peptidoglycan/xylan/chitin deacetylase (PgdA/CDA1 family)